MQSFGISANASNLNSLRNFNAPRIAAFAQNAPFAAANSPFAQNAPFGVQSQQTPFGDPNANGTFANCSAPANAFPSPFDAPNGAKALQTIDGQNVGFGAALSQSAASSNSDKSLLQLRLGDYSLASKGQISSDRLTVFTNYLERCKSNAISFSAAPNQIENGVRSPFGNAANGQTPNFNAQSNSANFGFSQNALNQNSNAPSKSPFGFSTSFGQNSQAKNGTQNSFGFGAANANVFGSENSNSTAQTANPFSQPSNAVAQSANAFVSPPNNFQQNAFGFRANASESQIPNSKPNSFALQNPFASQPNIPNSVSTNLFASQTAVPTSQPPSNAPPNPFCQNPFPTSAANTFPGLPPPSLFAFATNTVNEAFALLPGATRACPLAALRELFPTNGATLQQQLERVAVAPPSFEEEFNRLARSAFFEASLASHRTAAIDSARYSEARNAARAKMSLPKIKPRTRLSNVFRAAPPTELGDAITVRLSFNGFAPTVFVEHVDGAETLGALLGELVNRKALLSREEARAARYSVGDRVLEAMDALRIVVEGGGVLDVAVGGAKERSEALRASPELLPQIGESDLSVEPSIEALARLSAEELAAVPRFSVWNAHARVDFLAPVDLRGAKLDQILSLRRRCVEAYPPGTPRPPIGAGLNCPARITLYDFGFPAEDARGEFGRRLAASVRAMGARIVAEEPSTQSLIIEVDHF